MPAGFPVEVVMIELEGGATQGKECTTCRQVKPLTDFYQNRLGVGGRNARCKTCESIAKKEYRQANVEKERCRHKKYRTENRDRCKRASYRWAKENPVAHGAIQHRKRARDRSLPATITSRELEEILDHFGGRCAISGASLDIVWDHFITLSTGKVGSVKENMVPLSAHLNKSKGDQNPIVWFQTVRERYDLSVERFVALLEYLARLNGMDMDEYVHFVNACYEGRK